MAALIVREGEIWEMLDLRHEILRAGLPRELAHFEGDDEPTTQHVVAETDGRIVGCVTILHRHWNAKPAWQLRGMAVAKVVQGQGIGGKLLDEVERIARTENYADQFWCNARTSAIKFYEKHGWQVASGEFQVQHAGPHVKMTKTLKPQKDSDERG